MDFFTHPWYMAAGGAAVSLPILIHLINRMRFKRIRWAAMEFLLKSQKRNRRRLIIEQLILLMLRILLVLLAGFLVARFLFSGAGARGATHIVIVDDTMSMADKGQAGPAGQTQTAYEIGIEQNKDTPRNPAQPGRPPQPQHYPPPKADPRGAVEDAESELTASIMNYAQAEARTFLQVYVNGEPDLTRDMPLEKLRPGEVTQHKFTLRFPKRGGAKTDINEKDGPEE